MFCSHVSVLWHFATLHTYYYGRSQEYWMELPPLQRITKEYKHQQTYVFLEHSILNM